MRGSWKAAVSAAVSAALVLTAPGLECWAAVGRSAVFAGPRTNTPVLPLALPSNTALLPSGAGVNILNSALPAASAVAPALQTGFDSLPAAADAVLPEPVSVETSQSLEAQAQGVPLAPPKDASPEESANVSRKAFDGIEDVSGEVPAREVDRNFSRSRSVPDLTTIARALPDGAQATRMRLNAAPKASARPQSRPPVQALNALPGAKFLPRDFGRLLVKNLTLATGLSAYLAILPRLSGPVAMTAVVVLAAPFLRIAWKMKDGSWAPGALFVTDLVLGAFIGMGVFGSSWLYGAAAFGLINTALAGYLWGAWRHLPWALHRDMEAVRPDFSTLTPSRQKQMEALAEALTGRPLKRILALRALKDNFLYQGFAKEFTPMVLLLAKRDPNFRVSVAAAGLLSHWSEEVPEAEEALKDLARDSAVSSLVRSQAEIQLMLLSLRRAERAEELSPVLTDLTSTDPRGQAASLLKTAQDLLDSMPNNSWIDKLRWDVLEAGISELKTALAQGDDERTAVAAKKLKDLLDSRTRNQPPALNALPAGATAKPAIFPFPLSTRILSVLAENEDKIIDAGTGLVLLLDFAVVVGWIAALAVSNIFWVGISSAVLLGFVVLNMYMMNSPPPAFLSRWRSDNEYRVPQVVLDSAAFKFFSSLDRSSQKAFLSKLTEFEKVLPAVLSYKPRHPFLYLVLDKASTRATRRNAWTMCLPLLQKTPAESVALLTTILRTGARNAIKDVFSLSELGDYAFLNEFGTEGRKALFSLLGEDLSLYDRGHKAQLLKTLALHLERFSLEEPEIQTIRNLMKVSPHFTTEEKQSVSELLKSRTAVEMLSRSVPGTDVDALLAEASAEIGKLKLIRSRSIPETLRLRAFTEKASGLEQALSNGGVDRIANASKKLQDLLTPSRKPSSGLNALPVGSQAGIFPIPWSTRILAVLAKHERVLGEAAAGLVALVGLAAMVAWIAGFAVGNVSWAIAGFGVLLGMFLLGLHMMSGTSENFLTDWEHRQSRWTPSPLLDRAAFKFFNDLPGPERDALLAGLSGFEKSLIAAQNWPSNLKPRHPFLYLVLDSPTARSVRSEAWAASLSILQRTPAESAALLGLIITHEAFASMRDRSLPVKEDYQRLNEFGAEGRKVLLGLLQEDLDLTLDHKTLLLDALRVNAGLAPWNASEIGILEKLRDSDQLTSEEKKGVAELLKPREDVATLSRPAPGTDADALLAQASAEIEKLKLMSSRSIPETLKLRALTEKASGLEQVLSDGGVDQIANASKKLQDLLTPSRKPSSGLNALPAGSRAGIFPIPWGARVLSAVAERGDSITKGFAISFVLLGCAVEIGWIAALVAGNLTWSIAGFAATLVTLIACLRMLSGTSGGFLSEWKSWHSFWTPPADLDRAAFKFFNGLSDAERDSFLSELDDLRRSLSSSGRWWSHREKPRHPFLYLVLDDFSSRNIRSQAWSRCLPLLRRTPAASAALLEAILAHDAYASLRNFSLLAVKEDYLLLDEFGAEGREVLLGLLQEDLSLAHGDHKIFLIEALKLNAQRAPWNPQEIQILEKLRGSDQLAAEEKQTVAGLLKPREDVATLTRRVTGSSADSLLAEASAKIGKLKLASSRSIPETLKLGALEEKKKDLERALSSGVPDEISFASQKLQDLLAGLAQTPPEGLNALPWRKASAFRMPILYGLYQHFMNHGLAWVVSLTILCSAPILYMAGPDALIMLLIFGAVFMGGIGGVLKMLDRYYAAGVPPQQLNEEAYKLFQSLSHGEQKSILSAFRQVGPAFAGRKIRFFHPFLNLVHMRTEVRAAAWAKALPILKKHAPAAAALLEKAVAHAEAEQEHPLAAEYETLNALGPAGHDALLRLAGSPRADAKAETGLIAAIESGVATGSWSREAVETLAKLLDTYHVRLASPQTQERLRRATFEPPSLPRQDVSTTDTQDLIERARLAMTLTDDPSRIGGLRRKVLKETVESLEKALAVADVERVAVLSARLRGFLSGPSAGPGPGLNALPAAPTTFLESFLARFGYTQTEFFNKKHLLHAAQGLVILSIIPGALLLSSGFSILYAVGALAAVIALDAGFFGVYSQGEIPRGFYALFKSLPPEKRKGLVTRLRSEKFSWDGNPVVFHHPFLALAHRISSVRARAWELALPDFQEPPEVQDQAARFLGMFISRHAKDAHYLDTYPQQDEFTLLARLGAPGRRELLRILREPASDRWETHPQKSAKALEDSLLREAWGPSEREDLARALKETVGLDEESKAALDRILSETASVAQWSAASAPDAQSVLALIEQAETVSRGLNQNSWIERTRKKVIDETVLALREALRGPNSGAISTASARLKGLISSTASL